MKESVSTAGTTEKKNVTTSRVFCVNTGHTYVYELLNGEIISEEKILV